MASILASFAVAAGPVAAAEPGWYVGLSLGQAQADGVEAGKLPVAVVPGTLVSSADDKDSAGKAFVGFRFLPWLGAEVTYADYGNTRASATFSAQRTGTSVETGAVDVKRSARSLGIDLVGGVNVVDSVFVFGRVGWVEAEVESTVTTNLISTIASGSFFGDNGEGQSRSRKSRNGSAKYGAGVEWSATRALGVRLEWERVDKAGDPYPFKGPDLRGFPLYHVEQGTGEGGIDMWSAGIVWRFP